jgi:hypothetical protein
VDVVTWGSSGCPRLPTRLDVIGRNAISITMSNGAPPAFASCPADSAPTTSIIRIPGTVDAGGQISVTTVDGVYGTTVVLPPLQASSG